MVNLHIEVEVEGVVDPLEGVVDPSEVVAGDNLVPMALDLMVVDVAREVAGTSHRIMQHQLQIWDLFQWPRDQEH